MVITLTLAYILQNGFGTDQIYIHLSPAADGSGPIAVIEILPNINSPCFENILRINTEKQAIFRFNSWNQNMRRYLCYYTIYLRIYIAFRKKDI